MRNRLGQVFTSAISLYVIISMVGCTIAWEGKANTSFSPKDIMDPVAALVDEQYRTVEPVLREHDEAFRFLSRSRGTVSDGHEIVLRMLEEPNGEEYLAFSYALLTADSSEEVIAQAESLITPEEYQSLLEEVSRARAHFDSLSRVVQRDLPPSQKAPFLRDLQKLLTKTIVLMVAGIVYAAIPGVVFWGKVTAAAAVSVAAGVVATTFMSLYRYYTLDEDSMAESFQDWIVDVTTDPSASYAVAASLITVGKTMGNGPVVTGLIVLVFSLYNVLDMVKPMLKKYNFNA